MKRVFGGHSDNGNARPSKKIRSPSDSDSVHSTTNILKTSQPRTKGKQAARGRPSSGRATPKQAKGANLDTKTQRIKQLEKELAKGAEENTRLRAELEQCKKANKDLTRQFERKRSLQSAWAKLGPTKNIDKITRKLDENDSYTVKPGADLFINSQEYQDAVVKGEADPDRHLLLARVKSIRGDRKKTLIEVTWFYRPSECSEGFIKQYGENKAESLLRGFGGKEVFLSNHDDIIEADSVLDFANVYSFDTQDTQAAWIPALAYFTRFNVDARNNPQLKLSYIFQPRLSIPDVLYNPEKDAQVFCPNCNRWQDVDDLQDIPDKERQRSTRGKFGPLKDGPVIRGLGWLDLLDERPARITWLKTGTLGMISEWPDPPPDCLSVNVAGEEQEILDACVEAISTITAVWNCTGCNEEI